MVLFSTARRLMWAPGLALALALIPACGRPPQIGADRDSFKAVDALYTAVSLRDPKELDRCAASLKTLGESKKLTEAAARSLDAIVAEARGGGWESAQTRLAAFMRGQRR
jgi:hypothetical protein